jgi:hypothetical protein
MRLSPGHAYLSNVHERDWTIGSSDGAEAIPINEYIT